MNIPATPPSSAGLIDRLAEMAEGLRERLDEGGGGLGEIIFVVVVLHYLLRIASLYVRFKAGLLAPRRTNAVAGPAAPALDRTSPHATSRLASPIQPRGEATQAPRIAAASVPLTSACAPAQRARPAFVSPRPVTPAWREGPGAEGLPLVIRARLRRPEFSTARACIALARL